MFAYGSMEFIILILYLSLTFPVQCIA